MPNDVITEQLKQLPSGPGVYLMRDDKGNILYVGKASDLHNRVRSYFSGGQTLTPKLKRLTALVNDIDFLVTNSEQEALILESNLIKRYRPRYNVRLKDDKTFPYLKIDPNDDWPRVYITRRLEEDGGHYFGPFAIWYWSTFSEFIKGLRKELKKPDLYCGFEELAHRSLFLDKQGKPWIIFNRLARVRADHQHPSSE